MAINRNNLTILVVVVLLGAGASWYLKTPAKETVASTIALPKLDDVQQAGNVLFDKNCATCHGVSGGGTKQGPPLIHKYYEPSHHGDDAFIWAAKQGVRAHHWNFGDMPPINSVSDGDVQKIIQFIRAVQRENGIS